MYVYREMKPSSRNMKAYIFQQQQQIIIEESDRNFLMFWWFKNLRDKQPEVVQCRFCYLAFGLTSSPAILNADIQKHLPQITQLLAESFYVDDILGGAMT